MANDYDLDGRVAIITGGAQGIGNAIAHRLVASGARLAIWDIDGALAERAARDIASGGAQAMAFTCDVTDFAEVETTTLQTLERFGRIDILVNNAGMTGPNGPLVDYKVEDWLRVLDLNLNGSFYASKAVVPTMIAQNYGRIINIASIAGKEGNPNAAAYSAAKAGVIAMTKSLGKELSHYDIAVNCVTPGAARTALFEQMDHQHIELMLTKIPRGRFALLTEIASMVAFLASSENSFTTGAVFDLSGGRATY